MPTKVQLDKAAWKWVDDVTEADGITFSHVETAYRCNLRPCPQGECKRNCRGNPFCLNSLGEKRWFEELDESKWHEFDPEGERRTEGQFVGLKNLGATCYVNTFLQLWFHNENVRRAVYEWQDFDEFPSDLDADWKPTSICGHLQLIFGLLQHSKRAYVDPSPLIECLGLDTREQQDAQEFSKLFLSVLERALSQTRYGLETNIIQEQFTGTYSYVTKCQACGSESSRDATFYELDINIAGHISLHSSLQDFLKEEKLEGENQYMCSVCNRKQNAVRSIRLKSLPPVLNLQLLRFVFDVKRGQKKKLNSYLQFGDTLDMSRYLQQPDNTTVYDLTAVLIHRGTSAYSGHYIAHILDTASKVWYRFNDEEIAVMKGRKLQLGKEEEIGAGDPSEGTSDKAPRTTKGMYSSRNAYMLVYSRRDASQSSHTEPSICTESAEEVSSTTAAPAAVEETKLSLKSPPVEPPAPVMRYIEQDNAKFEDWIQDIALTRDANIFSGKEQQQRIQQMYTALYRSSDDEPFEWLPFDWLSKWLTDPENVSEINCARYLCSHKRLHPDNVVKMKIVSTEGAEQIYSQFKGGPRLKGKEALCEDCVRHRCQELHFKNLLAEHGKFFNTALRQPADSATSYWVGKASLRSWKRLAKDEFDKAHCINSDEADASNSNGVRQEDENGTENGVADANKSSDDKENGEESVEEKNGDGDGMGEADEAELSATQGFNSDLLCDEHGGLQPNETCRRLVPDTVWKRLRCLFPSCPEFPRDAPVCQKCTEQLEREEELKVSSRQWCVAQREALQDLYSGRNRPKPPDLGGRRVFVLSEDFVEDWRKFIRNKDRSRRDALQEIVNVPLLCNHGKLLYPVDQPESNQENGVVLVWEEEWNQLTECYSYDTAIEMFTVEQDDGQKMVISVPEVCDSCVAERLQEEEEQKYTFEQATVYVRKVVPPLLNNNAATPTTDSDQSAKEDDDPEFQEVTKDAGDGEPNAKKQKVDDANLRKSQRHRKQRGEKEVKISSSMTLKDFKIKVMNLFSIPTFDQNLCLEGRSLTDNESTLKQLRFYPGCVVIVKADVASQDAAESVMNESYSARKPEEGFKGTNLLSC